MAQLTCLPILVRLAQWEKVGDYVHTLGARKAKCAPVEWCKDALHRLSGARQPSTFCFACHDCGISNHLLTTGSRTINYWYNTICH